ncbi:MAG: NAD(P)H-hydrate epimerase [bacterium]
MKLVTADEMAELDRHAIKDLKIPSLTLMENAGRAVADEVCKIPEIHKILVVCGKGNNGGDGFVAARYLAERGYEVEVVLIGNRDEVKHDPKVNIEQLKKLEANNPTLKCGEYTPDFSLGLQAKDIIVDSLFGIGLKTELKPPYIDIINQLNSTGKPIIAVDVPSGLDATTGKVLGAAIKATKTVTFAAAKTGFYKEEGPAHTGEVVVVDIGIPL